MWHATPAARAGTRSAGSSEMSFLLLSPLSPTAGSHSSSHFHVGPRTTAPSPTSSSACGETETEGKGGAQAHVHELEVVLVVLERGADGAVTASSAAAPAPLTRHTCPSRRRRREGGPLRWAARSGGHGCRRDQLDGERPLGEAEQGGELGLGLGRCLRIRRPTAADRSPGRRASPGGAGGRATAYSAPAATGADGRRRARPR